MKTKKKMFKHGGSFAVVVPAEFSQNVDSNEVSIEVIFDENNMPSLIMKPINELDTIEEDPIFALFIQGLYEHAMENPKTLKDGSQILNDHVDKLLEGVEVDDD
jgi:hypothetical protein